MEIGVLLSLESRTKKMRAEVASAGFYDSDYTKKKHPRMQIITVAELMEGRVIDIPSIRQTGTTFKKAKKAKRKPTHRQERFDE